MVAGLLAAASVACGRDDDTSATPGFDGETITIGVLTPLQGPVAASARPLTAGNEVYFDYVNEELGGIGGRYPVRLLLEDTSYDESTAVTKYQKVKDDVVLFGQVYGTPIVNALSPLLARDGVVASPASLDATWVSNPNLLPVGAPYQVQFANAAEYYLTEGGGAGSTICFAGLAGSYGDAGLAGVELAGRHLDFSVASVARYNRGDKEFTAQISQLDRDGCDAVFLNALPTDTGLILSQADQAGFTPRWIAQSPSWSPDLLASDALPVLVERLWVVNEGAEWGDRSIPGEADLLDRLARYKPGIEPDHTITFGYVQAWAVAQVLEHAVAEGDLSREGIARALEEVDVLSFDGLSGDYVYGPPAQRVAPRESTLFRINPDKPLGLEAVKTNFATDTARALSFS